MLWHLCFGGAFGFVAVESMFTIKCFFSSLGTGGGRGERKDHNSVFGGAEPWRLNITPFVIGGVRVPCISGRNEGG